MGQTDKRMQADIMNASFSVKRYTSALPSLFTCFSLCGASLPSTVKVKSVLKRFEITDLDFFWQLYNPKVKFRHLRRSLISARFQQMKDFGQCPGLLSLVFHDAIELLSQH